MQREKEKEELERQLNELRDMHSQVSNEFKQYREVKEKEKLNNIHLKGKIMRLTDKVDILSEKFTAASTKRDQLYKELKVRCACVYMCR